MSMIEDKLVLYVCALHVCTAVQSAHTCTFLPIALLLDTTMTVSCPQRSLDIQCKSDLVDQGVGGS